MLSLIVVNLWRFGRLGAPEVAAPGGLAASTQGAGDGSGDATLFLGQDFFPWMVLALGAAMLVGNGLALVRSRRDGPSVPFGRAVAMMALGGVAAAWGLASLIA